MNTTHTFEGVHTTSLNQIRRWRLASVSPGAGREIWTSALPENSGLLDLAFVISACKTHMNLYVGIRLNDSALDHGLHSKLGTSAPGCIPAVIFPMPYSMGV